MVSRWDTSGGRRMGLRAMHDCGPVNAWSTVRPGHMHSLSVYVDMLVYVDTVQTKRAGSSRGAVSVLQQKGGDGRQHR